MLPKFHYKICNSSFNRYRGSSFIYRGNNWRKYCEALVQIGYNNRQLERRRLADHLWASTLPLAGKQAEGVAPLAQTELRFQSLWREGWKVDRSTTSNVFLPRREGEGKQRHRCRETVVIPGNCTVISHLRVIYCLNSTTARFRVYATDHSNRCHIYTDISEQLICSYPQLIVASSTLLPPPTLGELGDIVTAGATVCDTWTHVDTGSELGNRWRRGAAGKT